MRDGAGSAMLDLVNHSLRRRLALEWWAAIAVVTVAAIGLVLGLASPVSEVWLLVLLGVVVVVVVPLLILAFRNPVASPPVMPRGVGYEAATRAGRSVRRGEPVEPPEVQAAAIGQARRGLRISNLTLGWFPVLGATWALRIGEPGFFGGFGYVGIAMMLLGAGGLVWSRLVQRRLTALETAGGRLPDQVGP